MRAVRRHRRRKLRLPVQAVDLELQGCWKMHAVGHEPGPLGRRQIGQLQRALGQVLDTLGRVVARDVAARAGRRDRSRRRDQIDGDPARETFGSEALREAIERGLDRRVERRATVRIEPAVGLVRGLRRHGPHVHDPPCPARLHEGDRRAREHEGRAQVVVHGLVIGLVAHLGDRCVLRIACIVDQYVEAARERRRPGDERLAVRFALEIRGEGERLAARLLDQVDGLAQGPRLGLRRVEAPRGHDDRRSGGY